MAWIRSGECNRCGECCNSGNPGQLADVTPVVPGACALYRIGEDGKGMCSNRNHEYYLSGCNVWPSHPDQIVDYPSCSYTFEWQEDDEDNSG